MSMKKTEKGTKKFTETEKMAIIKEAKERGIKVTLEKYDLYPATFYYWKRNYDLKGEAGLSHQKKDENKLVKVLLEENARLKQLVAEKELENNFPGIPIKKIRLEWKRQKWSDR